MTRDLPVLAAGGSAARSSALNRRVLIGVIIAAVLLGPARHLLQRPLTGVAAFHLAATVGPTALVLWRFSPSDNVPEATPWAVVGARNRAEAVAVALRKGWL